MSSTTSPSMTIAQALTTPFVAPSGCADNFVPANPVTTGRSQESLSIFVSAAVDSRFAPCQPPGWDRGRDGTSFAFSPAVCPSAWTAYRLGQNYLASARNGNYTAKCCSSGFTLTYGVEAEGIYQFPCARTLVNNLSAITRTSTITQGYVNNTAITSISMLTTTTGTTTLSIHNAWLISWDPSDASTLSPSPPMLRCTESAVDVWVPGETTVVPGRALDKCGPGESPRFGGLTGFLVIGLPLICVFLVVSCGTFFCLRHRKHRERRHVMRASASQISKKDEDQSTSQKATKESISVQESGNK
ncbi:unnamed protein product [Clonostachys byssicola]|uniref:Uncharacterized protein n=1 Tax=Clonostachys byssicola TaxID=160290 RepID=A0A9N9XVB5_9HYPO|nr:unnamed protein product [Clonostachys byssicola]